METQKSTSASVKIMLSYNYCHFEISKSISVDDGSIVTDQMIDDARKHCMRLADKAIEQYKIATDVDQKLAQLKQNHGYLIRRVEDIRKKPESEWTPRDKAHVKAAEDKSWWESRMNKSYDYDDDFDNDWDDDYSYDDSDDDPNF